MTAPVFDPAFVAAFDTLLHWRRDVRHFSTQPLPDGVMRTLLDTAALAPSVGNAQPWRFVRIRSQALRDRLAEHVDRVSDEAAAAMPDADRRAHYRTLKLHGIAEAPELLAVFCEEAPDAGHTLGRATMPEMLRYSTVMAIHTLWLAARARGIGLGWVSILDPAVVTELLDVPPGWTLIALLCLGYPAAPSAIPELEQRGWQAREPVEDRIVER
ncbi:5,6-dimethylbenzimidazole synthase [Sphingomonas echinoides]|uniref:5,6-dimethylbenzimidazole synthase n=1 Tax=Sphingomonas echinoides TaxID=59803 RepID=UPI002413BF89|nr:5,6-dimethylbenzimidazole synthase [Sphingomonas echinoides]